MLIQVITNLYPLPWEPQRASFNRQQFDRLAAANEVHVLVLVPWLTALRQLGNLRPRQDGKIHIEYLPYFYLPRIGRRLMPFFVFLSLLFKLPALARRQIDCLLLSWAYPDAVAGTMLARLLKLPCVIKVHGSDVNMHGLHPARAKQIAWAMGKAASVLSVSEDLKTKLVAMGVPAGRINVIYNGVSKDIFHPLERAACRARLGLSPERRIILYIGNLKAAKGCVDLLEAFRELSIYHPLAQLYLAGTGDEAPRLRQYARDHGLDDRVVFLGSVRHADLGEWINASDLVALPSHNEGVPNVLLEAMSCGVPVVATRVGGIPEVVDTDVAGILVAPAVRQALVDGLCKALETQWDRQAISAGMRRFSWEHNTARLQRMLNEAGGNKLIVESGI